MDIVGYVNNNIYAKWESKICKVFFDPRNGEEVKEVEYEYGDIVEKPEDPVKDGFRFVGWYTEDVYHYSFTEEIGGDLALHAVYEPIGIAEYVVYHYLITDDGDLQLILKTNGYDSNHSTVTVSVLGTEYFYKNSYIVPDDELNAGFSFFDLRDGSNLYAVTDANNPASQTIDLSAEELADRTVIFYYREMDQWTYTISYLDIDNKAAKLLDDFIEETDLLYVTVSVPTITADDGTVWVPVQAVGKRLTKDVVGAALSPSGNNLLNIYYDVLHTLNIVVDEEIVDDYTRYLVKKETTILPIVPLKDNYVVWCYTENEDGTGRRYYPGTTFSMLDRDVTLYAQWRDKDYKEPLEETNSLVDESPDTGDKSHVEYWIYLACLSLLAMSISFIQSKKH